MKDLLKRIFPTKSKGTKGEIRGLIFFKKDKKKKKVKVKVKVLVFFFQVNMIEFPLVMELGYVICIKLFPLSFYHHL